MKRKTAYTEKERKSFIEKGFMEVGQDDNGHYIFWSNEITDVLSPRELEVFKMRDKIDIDIAEKLGISEKSVLSYRDKIKKKINLIK